MDILLTDIFSQCQDLSSFEGRRIKDAQGQSLYPIVHITEQDKPLIDVHIHGAMSTIHAGARYAISDVSYDDTSISITFVDGNAKNISGDAEKVLKECISMYVMQHWLEDKDEARSKAYELMYTNLLASFARLAYRKHAPSLEDYIA